jgi:iron complex transport system substrate-binding protein
MNGGEKDREAPTRRDYVTYGGAVITGGLLAGCSSNGSSSTDSPNATPTEATETTATTTTDAEPTTTEWESFDVTVKPYGSTTFESAPKTYATSGGAWTDFGFAFGSEPTAMSRIEPYPTRYYDLLPGVTFDTSGMTNLGDPGAYNKEQFYELDVDTLLMDKILINSYAGWETQDFEEIEENVAPFCGSYVRGSWAGEALGIEFSFPYYTLTEAVELTGDLFQNQARAEAWVSLHESFRSDLQSQAPSASPSIGLLYSASKPADGTFMVTDPTLPGVATRQYRTFGVENAFVDVNLTDGWKTDYEGMLEADPEYLFFDSTLSMGREEFEKRFVTPLEESAVGSELTAVQEGNIFRGGGRYQGPIINLFVIEVLAKQLYPEQFDEFTTFDDIASGGKLFDRQRVADIINGDI